MGAGGSTIAITWHLMRRAAAPTAPARIVVSNRSRSRGSTHIRTIHGAIGSDVPRRLRARAERPATTTACWRRSKPGSLVVNATGLGKDAPGSPLDRRGASSPSAAVAWELNYRGDLVFLDQARRQQARPRLQVEDGWTYFLHGWTQVIAEVFDIAIPTSGPGFDAIARIAAEATGGTRPPRRRNHWTRGKTPIVWPAIVGPLLGAARSKPAARFATAG